MLIFIPALLYSQQDTIKSQILGYDDSRSTLISKGRNLLLDNFMAGDISKVREIKDYLVENADKDYITFYPVDYWFILYWTGDYMELAEDIRGYDSTRLDNYSKRIRPMPDMLYDKLLEKSLENESRLKREIGEAGLDEETRQFLTLNLDYLFLESRKDDYKLDTLNEQAGEFLDHYSSGRYGEFTRQYIRYKMVPKNWGITFEFFTGYGFFKGNLSEHYTNNIPFGVAFDICYKNFELYLRDYIGFNKTRQDKVYSLGTFEKGSRTMVFLPEASLGYVMYNDNRLKVSPFAGIGAMDISPSTADTEKTPELKEVNLKFNTTTMAGINFDIKFGPQRTPQFRPKASYGFMRVRYALNFPQFGKKYDGMEGTMHYVTIGFGGMARGLKREL